MQDIIDLVSTLGFPVVVAIALAYFIYQAFLKITDSNKEREAKLYNMIVENQIQMKKAIEMNASFVDILQDFRADVTKMQTDIEKIHEDISDIKYDIDRQVDQPHNDS